MQMHEDVEGGGRGNDSQERASDGEFGSNGQAREKEGLDKHLLDLRR